MLSDYQVTGRLSDGDISHLSTALYTPVDANEAKINEALRLKAELTGTPYVPASTSGATESVILKQAKSPLYNELLAKEEYALNEIAAHRVNSPEAIPFLPQLIEGNVEGPLQVNVLPHYEGFLDLATVRERTGGVNAEDVAWMWRRLLMALSDTANAGLVHSAVLPEHVLIHPTSRNLVLIDWCYSCEKGDFNAERVGRREAWYPPEMQQGDRVYPNTDIFMATKTMLWLMDTVPPQLQAFAQACLQPVSSARPSDPLALLGHLDELLERLYGKRKYRPFDIPSPA